MASPRLRTSQRETSASRRFASGPTTRISRSACAMTASSRSSARECRSGTPKECAQNSASIRSSYPTISHWWEMRRMVIQAFEGLARARRPLCSTSTGRSNRSPKVCLAPSASTRCCSRTWRRCAPTRRSSPTSMSWNGAGPRQLLQSGQKKWRTPAFRPAVKKRPRPEQRPDQRIGMKLWVDADAAPRDVKDVCFRASERLSLETVLVANQRIILPVGYRYLSAVRVDGGPDVADIYIADHADKGDVAVTAGISHVALLVSP